MSTLQNDELIDINTRAWKELVAESPCKKCFKIYYQPLITVEDKKEQIIILKLELATRLYLPMHNDAHELHQMGGK